jgi:hypothetical protein
VSPNYVELRTLGDVSGTLVGREGQELTLECVAYGGTPAPSIIWHVGGDLLTDQAVPYSQERGTPAPSIIWHVGGDLLTDQAVPYSQVGALGGGGDQEMYTGDLSGTPLRTSLAFVAISENIEGLI